jgi:glyoxylase-like metal-dependent hydrolase (beta-lactamase superfamily II)
MSDDSLIGMIIETRACTPFFKNGFVLGCEDTREAVVIDPGDEVVELIDAVSRLGLSVRHILLTHAHVDHITGVGAAKAAFKAPIALHRDDLFLYDRVVEVGRMFGLQVERQPPVDVFYEPGQHFTFGRYVVRPHHTPGHCPGGVCLQVGRASDPDGGKSLFVGDTLFAGSIGRTDLPGGNYETLIASIKDVLFAFGDDARVYPGHGPETTIGDERRTNPFLQE